MTVVCGGVLYEPSNYKTVNALSDNLKRIATWIKILFIMNLKLW